ncbi:MAG: hypothetical protein U0232_17190 [Thermomicrobiales bacterium]
MMAGDGGGGLAQGEGAERRAQSRLGALSAIVGAALALVVNLLYPVRPDNPEALLTLVAGNANWGLLNFGLMVSTLLILGGLYSLSQIAQGPLARGLAQLGLIAALPGAGSMLAGVAVEGYALKALADRWAGAAGADKAEAFRVALAVEQVQQALFYTWAAFFVGAPFLLLGLSGLAVGGGFPRWIGAIGAVGGAGGLATGAAGLLGTPLPSLVFVVAATAVTLWILIAGVVALRGAGRLGVAASGFAATIAPAPGQRGGAV